MIKMKDVWKAKIKAVDNMKDKKDGGNAFPNGKSIGEVSQLTGGMSLRDYFAGQALSGLCANSYADGMTQPLATAPNEVFAEISYRLADAMLKERES